MRIRLLAFAGVREILGETEQAIELDEGATLGDLRRVLEASYPEIESYWERLAVAIDGRMSGPEAKLYEGAEVALLPPVSGGNGDWDHDDALVEGPIDVERVVRRVRSRGRGAVLTFEGSVRDRHRDRPVTHLVYDAYRPMAEEVLERIAAELEDGEEGLAVGIIHRLGRVAAGETSVVIAVASPHRDAAYRVSRQALERIKREAPIWKREHYADGAARWREEEPLTPARVPTATP